MTKTASRTIPPLDPGDVVELATLPTAEQRPTAPPPSPTSKSKPAVRNGDDATPVGPDTEAASAAERPAWLGKPKSRVRAPKIVVVDDEPENLTWSQRLRRVLFGPVALVFMVSTVVHALFLLALAFIFLEVNIVPYGTLDFDAALGEEDASLGEGLDTSLDAGGAAEPEVLATLVATNVDANLPPSDVLGDLEQLLVPNATGTGNGDGEGTGDGEGEAGGGGVGLKYLRPGSGKFVTKGSFTVWTVPEDPRPMQRYQIVIELRLPESHKSMKTFPISDLAGTVRGTDNYVQMIPDPRQRNSRKLPIHEGVVQMVVDVPGAERLVEDTIDIRSRAILNESQRLRIEF